MHSRKVRYTVASLALCGLAIPAPAAAQASAPDEQERKIEELQDRERAALERIEALEARLGALEALLDLGDGVTLTDAEQAELRGRGVGTLLSQASSANVPEQTQTATGADETSAEEGDRKTPAPSESVETVAQREQGYFGERLSFEAGVNYAHFDDARVNLSGFLALDAIFLGLISIDETTADVVTTDFTARLGINDRLQVDVNVPWLYRHTNFQSGGAGGNASGLVEASTSDSGLGDISVGASYRLVTETFNRPDVVANVRVKAPTGRDPFGIELVEVAGSEGNLEIPEKLSFGTGVWSNSAGLSVLKTLDPMVVFGSVTYFRNWRGSFDDIEETTGDQPGSVKLGDAIQYGAGIAFALNERSSLSTSFTQRFVHRTKLRPLGGDWQSVVGSQANVALLNFGATFSLAEGVSLLTNVSVGMTADAPDMVIGVRLPFRF